MEWIIILIAVISIITSVSKKKKQKQQTEAQRRTAQKVSQMESAQPVRPVQPTQSARFPGEFVQQPAARPQPVRQQQVTMADLPVRANLTQAEIERRRQAVQTQMAERAHLTQQRQGTAFAPQSSITHVVKPMTESPHAHTESSMGGGEACPPPNMSVASGAATPAAMSVPVLQRQTAALSAISALGFSQKELARGILYSEILGKPKALRNTRR